jgi:glucosamine--fructose-6-phosphate aminotransferase (isomerizing)
MCGIVGYIGDKKARPVLLDGLKKLEYRGYDSGGIATQENDGTEVCKSQGKVASLEAKCGASESTIGIGHTRWATHGEPSELNAHPHQVGDITLVHNGIIENYSDLKESLEGSGYVFKSQTDTEVLTALIDSETKSADSLPLAVRGALKQVVGTFGIAVLSQAEPEQIIIARRGSPLLLGVGSKEFYIASDASAIVGKADKVVYLEDDQLAIVKKDTYEVVDLDNNAQVLELCDLDQEQSVAEKDGYDHFLIKEIHEQPQVVEDTYRGRLQHDGSVKLGGLNIADSELKKLKQIIIIGCGTAYYAGLLGKYMLEQMTGVPVSVEFGSEFRYRNAAVDTKDTIAIFMSQSGETADTLASLTEIKKRGIHSLGFVNTVGSSLAREVDGGIYLHAGPEISVASTKAYTAMMTALMMFGLKIAGLKGRPQQEIQEIADALRALPDSIKQAVKISDEAKKIATELKDTEHSFYLGRADLFPTALEGSLKLMEVSYIHAQCYPTGEMKHGPIALIDKDFLSVVLLPEDELLYSKSISNLEEIKARRGKVMSVSSRTKLKQSDYHLQTPKVSKWIEPLVINVALQLFAYHMAVARGNDVDRPRNLAKSVTVE